MQEHGPSMEEWYAKTEADLPTTVAPDAGLQRAGPAQYPYIPEACKLL